MAEGCEDTATSVVKGEEETAPLVSQSHESDLIGRELEVLRAAPVNNPRVWKWRPKAPSWEGYAYKRRTTGQWKMFYFDLRGLRLSYYKHQGDQKPRRTLAVAFASVQPLDAEDALASKQIVESTDGIASSEVCHSRLTVFTPSRTFVLAARTDDDLSALYLALEENLSVAYGEDEMQKKKDTSESLRPAMLAQHEIQVAELNVMVETLQSLGLLSDSFTKFSYKGRLEMLHYPPDAEGQPEWVPYYFGLRKGYMLYYPNDGSASTTVPRGVISLRHAFVTAMLGDRNRERPTVEDSKEDMEVQESRRGELEDDEADDDEGSFVEDYDDAAAIADVTSRPRARGADVEPPIAVSDELGDTPAQPPKNEFAGYPFRLVTPLRTYVFRARAEIVVNDWTKAIESASREVPHGDSSSRLGRLFRRPGSYGVLGDAKAKSAPTASSSNEPDMRFALSYTKGEGPKRKTKTVRVLPERPCTIGRSSTNTIVIDNPYCSRDHARVEVTGSDVFVYDLGSKYGTKVNNVAVSSQRLVSGDIIEIGDVAITCSACQGDVKSDTCSVS